MTKQKQAKAYAEILVKAKELKDANPTDEGIQRWVDDTFPELAESEDEKIRKDLIKMVNYFYGSSLNCQHSVSKEDILAWLEKQQYDDEWSDEDKEFLKWTLNNLAELKDRYGEDYGKVGKCIDWLNSLQPQPIDVEAVIAYQEGYQKAELEFYQKRQEWTDEDINMINWLIRCCEKEHEELCNDRYGHQEIVSDLKRDCRKKWDWLESLKGKVVPQKQWKPSEEQMKILQYLVENSSHPNPEVIPVLESLYEQLKTL